MIAELTVTNRIHIIRTSRKKDASISTKAESAETVAAEDVTLIDVRTSLQGIDGGRRLC